MLHTPALPRLKGIPVTWLLFFWIVFIWASFMSVDWMNYLYGLETLYPAYAKPVVSMLCAAIVFTAARVSLGRSDWRLLAAAFACIVIVDITMSIYVYGSNPPVQNISFLTGAVLSIAAHAILLFRHAKGFAFLRNPARPTWGYRWGFPLAFFVPVLGIFVLLSPALLSAGQFWPSLAYALILTLSLWVAWETVRQKLFPPRNALLIALGVTSWFITELLGVVHNIEIGQISDICMNLTWLFYLPGILLLALSGIRWESELPVVAEQLDASGQSRS